MKKFSQKYKLCHEKNTNLSIQLIPQVPSNIHPYDIVDKAIGIIQQSGLKYEVGPMETTIEGNLEECLEVVKKIQAIAIESGATSVLSNIKIQYNPSGVSMAEKIKKFR